MSLAIAGCKASPPAGVFPCAASHDCPAELECDLTSYLCERPETVVARRDPAPRDAAMSRDDMPAADGGKRAAPDATVPQPELDSSPSAGSGAAAPVQDAGVPPQRGGSAGMDVGGITDAGGAPGRAGAGGAMACTGAACAATCTADLDSSPEHCGACNHSCLGAACESGQCKPIHLAWGHDQLKRIVLAKDAIFYSDLISINKLPYEGGLATRLVLDTPLHQFAVDDSSIYTGKYFGPIFKVPREGGAQTVLAEHGWTQSISADAKYVYYLTSDLGSPNRLMRVPIAGGPAEPLTDETGGAEFTIDKDYVYWTSRGSGAVYKAPLTVGAAVQLTSGLMSPFTIAVDKKHVYWADDVELTLNMMDLDGKNRSMIASNVSCPDIVSDESHVYWVDNSETGGVFARAIAGGPIVNVAKSSYPIALAVDDRWVYWLKQGPSALPDAGVSENRKTGEILKVAK